MDMGRHFIRYCLSAMACFTLAAAPAIAAGPYAAHPPAFDGAALLAARRHWIARHHA